MELNSQYRKSLPNINLDYRTMTPNQTRLILGSGIDETFFLSCADGVCKTAPSQAHTVTD